MVQLLQLRSIQFMVLSIAILLLLTLTSPEQVGPLGVMLFFLMLYAWSFVGLRIVLGICRSKQFSIGFDDRHMFPVSLLSAYLPSLFALSSLSQFSWRDAVILFLAMAVIVFYWVRRFRKL